MIIIIIMIIKIIIVRHSFDLFDLFGGVARAGDSSLGHGTPPRELQASAEVAAAARAEGDTWPYYACPTSP